MNCKQFNNIPLEEVLQNLGHLPTKQNEKEAWYLNPFSNESQASFKLDKRQNLWYLFSEGIGGNNTDFMMKYLNASVKEVLVWVKEQYFSSFHQQNQNYTQGSDKTNYQITEIKELQNPNLIKYLQERGLSSNVYPLIKEVHFTIGDKKLYAIGFKNESGGWELRNQYYKGAVLKKDISMIYLNQNNQLKNKNVVVFEGFIDALSFVEIKRFFKGDLLVMNSIALLSKTKEQLKNYSKIHLFLDNDRSGEKCKIELLSSFPQAKECSKIYSDHKDLNEYLLHRIRNENKNQHSEKKQQEQDKQKHFRGHKRGR
ncbi:toprim domain-containing protein [Moheibacter lacus]|uniref:Toprim domain-containing protein n=1 Tax=Moheibacter lacus TaxID=2745851 RepID=A0A838ZL88_9FLAO|nr:toprim domain-containing protein [Moheibacter lacus]MBA5629224.1 toprim domain-containing protein [Moheibacter lacus]